MRLFKFNFQICVRVSWFFFCRKLLSALKGFVGYGTFSTQPQYQRVCVKHKVGSLSQSDLQVFCWTNTLWSSAQHVFFVPMGSNNIHVSGFLRTEAVFLCISTFYIYTIGRHFHPKTNNSFKVNVWPVSVAWESNPQPFAILTQWSELQKHSFFLARTVFYYYK